jgi:hypothetical protein
VAAASLAGRTTVNVEPLPGSLLTSTLPFELRDDPVDRREPEPDAVGARREERLERTRAGLRAHADARVGDFERRRTGAVRGSSGGSRS